MMEFSFKWTTRIFIFVTCLLNGIGVLDMSVVAENMNSCPSPSTPAWEERSVFFCYDQRRLDPSLYHCLQNQLGVFKEICTKAILIQKGSFPKWSDAGKQIYPELCPPGTYQEVQQMSNQFNMCRNKSKCTEDGQLASHCPDGGTTADQQCRCDYKKGYVANYYAFYNEMNKSCLFPREVENKCTILNTCPVTDELNPAYRCVNKCPTGYIRPEMEFECVKISSMKSTPPLTTGTTTTQESSTSLEPMDPKNGEEEWYKRPGFFISVLVAFSLSVVIVVSVILVRKRNGQPNCFESKEKEEAKRLHQNIPIELRKYLYKSEDGIQSDVLREFKLRAKGVGAQPWAVDDRKTDAADVFKSLEDIGKISLGNYEVLFQIIDDQATTTAVRQITEKIQNLLQSQE